jgi:hypothetical protein
MANQHYDTVTDLTAGSAYRSTLKKAFTIGIDLPLRMPPRVNRSIRLCGPIAFARSASFAEQIEDLD